MAYGYATHLWVLGSPSPRQLREWLLSAVPAVHEGDVEVWQLGDRVVLGAVNTSDRELRVTSAGVVQAVAREVRGFRWVSLDIQPDQGWWRVETSTGEDFEWESGAGGDAGGRPSPETTQGVREVLRSLVPLQLNEVHHYVDWAHALEDVADGGRAPVLEVPVRRVALDLPQAPTPALAVRVTQAPSSWLAKHWLAVAGVMATAFTVSMSQAPGPGAWTSRLSHFLIQATSLWVLGTVLAGVTSNGWPNARSTLWAGGVVVLGGVVWALVPF